MRFHRASVFQLAAEKDADLLLTVKNNQRRLDQQIVSQFSGHRHFPLVIGDDQDSHGRQVRWSLRARNATDSIRENSSCASWIIELMSNRWREGKPFDHAHLFIIILGTSLKALLQLVSLRWAIENQGHSPRDIQLREVAHHYLETNGVQIMAMLRGLGM